ncbi:TonB family protein [Vitiosangium sp. GDMCC 1.1324]|uniref:TonB family protein n=1 Tax=Vitiosangium sp. (strain GDMCC 1.1324) TaxID=2138576 RepID=UPI00130EEB98|nr:TonB family protein [Vitiosangium sp. GDMCC 1.1324]
MKRPRSGALRACLASWVVLLAGLWALPSRGQSTEPAAAPTPTVVPPRASCPAPPRYPESERASAREGQVVLHVLLNEAGEAQEHTVARGMGSPFDEAALEAAKACTFTPGTLDGKPVTMVVELSVDFAPPPPRVRLGGEVVGEQGEPLEGASVGVMADHATTDAQGHFELELEPSPTGELQVLVQKPGFFPGVFAEQLAPGEQRQVHYALTPERILETRVEDRRLLPEPPKVDNTPQVSRFHITAADIDRTPGAMEDVSRVVQSLPGVVADPDLLATFFVRGGGPNEVVFYLDGVPLSNPYHLGGFASLFNPMMIEAADFYAGSAPGRYEPALSGVLDITYATGETSKLKAWADLSVQTAKLRVDTPTGIDGLSVSLAARRSFFELYFVGLRALKIAGRNYVAPDVNEYMARVHYRRGRHEVTASLLHASDGFSFLVSPGEQLLVNFAGGLELSNTVQIAMLKERTDLGDDSELSFTLALSRDLNHTSLSGDSAYSQDAGKTELFAQSALQLKLSEHHRSRVGLQFTRRDQNFNGQVTDTRGMAPWSAQPFVDTGLGNLDVRPSILRNVLAAYAEHRYQPGETTQLDGSARLQLDLSSSQWTYSLHAGISQQLPTATVLKASAGLTTQYQSSPLLMDETYGNPALAPERAAHLIVGLEQPLPFQALVRLEGYGKWFSSLTVNPDTSQGVQERLSAGLPVFDSTGTGFARGMDLMLLGRTSRLSYGAAMGLTFSDRYNPLASGPKNYRAPWDQRFTASANVSYTPGNDWILSGRVSFHTGRPYTPVEGFVMDTANGRYLPVFGATNSAQYPNFLEGSVRVERRFNMGPLRGAWYAEVLNVTNAQNVYAYLYDTGTPNEGVLPVQSEFNHLPIRPFLGLRADY